MTSRAKRKKGPQAAKPTWLLIVHRGRHFLADCMAGGVLGRGNTFVSSKLLCPDSTGLQEEKQDSGHQ